MDRLQLKRPLTTLFAALACGLFAAAALAACASAALEPLPLQITVQASRATAAPGDTISFVATVQGSNLLGLATIYGDGATDQYGTSGARTAKVTFRHAYTTRGSYTVRITVTNGDASQQDATVGIQVL